jgi:hypothetical protein
MVRKITLPEDCRVAGELPLYTRPVLLRADRHGGKAILPSGTPFGFAQRAPTVPVTTGEFERAMLDYPLVFYGPRRRAMAVTGLAADRNLFVSADGRYASGTYVPAYLRRFPFVLARLADSDDMALCVEEDAACVVDREVEGALPLFDDGTPTAVVQDAMALCRAYDDAERRADALTAMLDEFELFEPRRAHFSAPGTDAPTLLLDYVAVSRARLAELGPADLATLRDAGALAAIYAHLFSQANWDVLPVRAATA